MKNYQAEMSDTKVEKLLEGTINHNTDQRRQEEGSWQHGTPVLSSNLQETSSAPLVWTRIG